MKEEISVRIQEEYVEVLSRLGLEGDKALMNVDRYKKIKILLPREFFKIVK